MGNHRLIQIQLELKMAVLKRLWWSSISSYRHRIEPTFRCRSLTSAFPFPAPTGEEIFTSVLDVATSSVAVTAAGIIQQPTQLTARDVQVYTCRRVQDKYSISAHATVRPPSQPLRCTQSHTSSAITSRQSSSTAERTYHARLPSPPGAVNTRPPAVAAYITLEDQWV